MRSAFSALLQSFGAAHQLGDFLGDRRLAQAVAGQRQRIHQLARVLARPTHRDHAGRLFGSQVFQRLIADKMTGWQGPLAGIHAALCEAQTEYVMSVPCDTPFLPSHLCTRLFDAISNEDTEAAVALAGGYRQPTIAIFRRQVLPGLEAFLGEGRRKVGDWLDTLRLSEVVFDHVEDFDNINSPEDLLRAEQRVAFR